MFRTVVPANAPKDVVPAKAAKGVVPAKAAKGVVPAKAGTPSKNSKTNGAPAFAGATTSDP